MDKSKQIRLDCDCKQMLDIVKAIKGFRTYEQAIMFLSDDSKFSKEVRDSLGKVDKTFEVLIRKNDRRKLSRP